MNYEQKYNEILEWARKYKARLNGVPIEEVLPELRESEDERIRKEMLAFFKNFYETGTWKSISDVNTWIAYLEKQKEQKPRKFKLGDKVHLEGDEINILTITGIEKDRYLTDNSYGPILFGAEDIWEIVEQKPAEKQDYSGLNDLERAIHRGFLSAGVENVPVTIIKETAQECLAQIKPAEMNLPKWSTNSDPNFKPGKYFCVANALISPQGWSITFEDLEKLPGFKEKV